MAYTDMILKRGQFFVDRSANSDVDMLYVGDGVNKLADLQPIGAVTLPPADGKVYVVLNKEWVPIIDDGTGVDVPMLPGVGDGSNSGGIGLPGSGGGAREVVGEIRAFMLDSPPAGWLDCNGATFNRLDYPELYDCMVKVSSIVNAAVGKIPDLRGQFLRGIGFSTVMYPNLGSSNAVNVVQTDAVQTLRSSTILYFGAGGWAGNGHANPTVSDPLISGAETGTQVLSYLPGSYAQLLATPQIAGSSNNGAYAYTPRIGYLSLDYSRSGVRMDTETHPVNTTVRYCIKY